MQLVILAAGMGRRMRPMTVDTPKSLLRVGGQALLGRLVHQFAEYADIERIVVVAGHSADRVAAATRQYDAAVELVRNPDFLAAGNAGSAHLAMRAIDSGGPVILLEADLWLEDRAVLQIVQAARSGQTTLFTNGPFDPGMTGPVLRHDADSRLDDLRQVASWTPALASYRKVLGALVLGAANAGAYADAVASIRGSTQPQSFLSPLADGSVCSTPAIRDLGDLHTASIDTASDYEQLAGRLQREAIASGTRVSLVPADWLRPLEASAPERVVALTERMRAEAIWHQALVVDREDFIVLDGQHRLEVAVQQGLRRVPVVLLELDSVPAWETRTGSMVAPGRIRARALAREPYARGALKLGLPHLDLSCRYVLTRLAA